MLPEDITKYVNQFDNADKNTANVMIERLKFVSHEEIKKYFIKVIKNNYNSKPKTAIYIITDINNHHYSSSETIGNFINNFVRSNNRFLYINPSLTSIKAEKISRFLFIDDSIGSGTRVISYLNNLDIIKTLRSWHSYKKCKIDILTYVAYEKGLNKIKSKIKIIDNFINSIEIKENESVYTDKMIDILKKYGVKTLKKKASLGYKKTLGFIFFEHGCPNNLPSIFWCDGNNHEWKSLFPNRGISLELIDYFKKCNSNSNNINLIADIGKSTLAVNLLEHIENKRINNDNLVYITILSLFSKKIKLNKFGKYIVLDKNDLKTRIKTLIIWGYLDKKNKLTNYGNDLLNRYTQSKKDQKIQLTNEFESFYLPDKFKDIPRNI